jgi:hypothetical protein
MKNAEEVHADTVNNIQFLLERLRIDPREIGISVADFRTVLAGQLSNSFVFSGAAKITASRPGQNNDKFGFSQKSPFLHHVENRQTGKHVIQTSEVILEESLILKTTETLSEKDVERILCSLQTMLTLSNHDFTMHQMGIIGGGNAVKTARLVLNVSDLVKHGNKSYPPEKWNSDIDVSLLEQLAASFHRVAMDRVFERAPQLKKVFLYSTLRVLRISSTLPPKLRQQWLSLLKYLTWSIIDPDSQEGIQIRQMAPPTDTVAGMEPGTWAKVVHRKNLPLRSGGLGSARHISTEDAFTALYLKSELIDDIEVENPGTNALAKKLISFAK